MLRHSRFPVSLLPTALAILILVSLTTAAAFAQSFAIVDTRQEKSFDNTSEIPAPNPGEDFYGQDAQYPGHAPAYLVSADGLTVEDATTGLVWQQMADTDLNGLLEYEDKLTWDEALVQAAALNDALYGGFDDWRLPTIKELYSLMDFRGLDPSGPETADLVPFLDTTVFDFMYGDENQGERLIDAQYWSATEYVSTTMNGDHTIFGVNFADGRIKGYPSSDPQGGMKLNFVLCVRGNANYGVNHFQDNGDGTVTDLDTGLMWQQTDSGEGLNWRDALQYAENLEFATYDDWRLPDAKELQGILDYTRSPATHGTAAIDPVFSCTSITDEGGNADFPFYWTGTTHENGSEVNGGFAVYICFGTALGWMPTPFPPFNAVLMDVHGAGAQRSDPKLGDPGDYPNGHGPQGDVVRIFNFVRCVRDADGITSVDEPHESDEPIEDEVPGLETGLRLENHPNPFNPVTEIRFTLGRARTVTLDVFDARGAHVRNLLDDFAAEGENTLVWDGTDQAGRPVPSGVYFSRLRAEGVFLLDKMLLTK